MNIKELLEKEAHEIYNKADNNKEYVAIPKENYNKALAELRKLKCPRCGKQIEEVK